MPSWASSLIRKTEVLRTTLRQPRAPGTEWEARPDPLAPKTHGRAGWNPSGESHQAAVALHPRLFHKPTPHGGNRHSLSVLSETLKGRVSGKPPWHGAGRMQITSGYLRYSREPACGGYIVFPLAFCLQE